MSWIEEFIQEQDKTRARLGRTTSEVMNWVIGFAQTPLETLSTGDLLNLTAEAEMFARAGAHPDAFAIVKDLHGTSRKRRPLDKTEMKALQDFALERLHELVDHHYTSFEFGNFVLMAGYFSQNVCFTQPIVQTPKDGFAYHLAQLFGEQTHRLSKCPECQRLFLPLRHHQKFCSPRCRSRVGTREFRKARAAGTKKKRGRAGTGKDLAKTR